jgi:predicted enzyme related to lactoylglutathione lyase
MAKKRNLKPRAARKARAAARRAQPAAARKAAARSGVRRRRAGAPVVDRRSKSQPETLRLRSAGPSLTVNDIARSLAFYRDVLGFHPKERYERDGKLAGIEMAAGAVSFWLSQDDWKKGRDRVKGEGFRMYCTTTQDIDKLAARVKASGGTLLEELHDEPWGRAFAVQDPDGFKLTISSETASS